MGALVSPVQMNEKKSIDVPCIILSMSLSPSTEVSNRRERITDLAQPNRTTTHTHTHTHAYRAHHPNRSSSSPRPRWHSRSTRTPPRTA